MSSACVDYVPALCTHRPSLLPIEWSGEFFGLWQRLRFSALMPREDTQTLSFRGRRSRNKVSVGEPAEGSLSFLHPHRAYCCRLLFSGGLRPLGSTPRSGGSTAPRLERKLGLGASPESTRRSRPPSLVTTKSHNSCRWISWHEQR